MGEPITVFVGLDVGEKFTDLCVLDDTGAIVETGRIRTIRRSFESHLRGYGRARVVLEVGMHSRWISTVLSEAGHEVVVANPRQVRLIWKRPKKTDKTDALLLARLGRVDVDLLAPVRHRRRDAHVDLACLRARDVLVSARTKLINHIRGALKPFGVRVEDSSSANAFPDAAQAVLPAELLPALGPMLETLRLVNTQIAAHDKQIEQLARTVYPESQRCSQVFGVGQLTALAFQLTIDDPTRFKKSRFVAAFLGLTPGKDQSGESDPQRHITKAGDRFVRKLLVECAHRVLSPVGGLDSDLRRWGLKLAERGGKNGRKRAVVAVARKLAVLLHRLWLSGERYQPTNYKPPVLAA
jgi:transposase